MSGDHHDDEASLIKLARELVGAVLELQGALLQEIQSRRSHCDLVTKHDLEKLEKIMSAILDSTSAIAVSQERINAALDRIEAGGIPGGGSGATPEEVQAVQDVANATEKTATRLEAVSPSPFN